jgi:hypothetical protein
MEDLWDLYGILKLIYNPLIAGIVHSWLVEYVELMDLL